MPRFRTAYDSDVAAKAKGKLKDLAKRKPKKITLRDLICELRPEIDQAKTMGHSLTDVVIALGESGVVIKEATLKQYLRDAEATMTRTGHPKF